LGEYNIITAWNELVFTCIEEMDDAEPFAKVRSDDNT
jgi:hypothetical protein